MANERYYQELPLFEKETNRVRAEDSHNQWNEQKLTGTISGTFTAKQPIHVGTGDMVPPQLVGLPDEVPLVKPFYALGNRLTIPATSLKGAVRSLVEAITYSGVAVTDRRWQGSEARKYGAPRYNWVDTAGRIFGVMGYQGPLSISDAPMLAGEMGIHYAPPQYPPQGDIGQRLYPHDLVDPREGTWPLQVAQPGSQFKFEAHYRNLSAAELGVLFIVLGQGTPPICLKIGAGKSSGLGGIRWGELAVMQVNIDALYTSYDSQKETTTQVVDVAHCVDVALRADGFLTAALPAVQAALGCSHLEEPS